MKIMIEIDEVDAALIWDDGWGASERHSTKQALEIALKDLARKCTGSRPGTLAAMRCLQKELNETADVGTIRTGWKVDQPGNLQEV